MSTPIGIRALVLLLIPAAWGQQLTVRVTPRIPQVADLVRLEVETSAPPGIEVALPDSVKLDCAAITEATDDPPRPLAGGRLLYRRIFVLDPNGAGPCRVPPLTAMYGERPISSQELIFDVRSALANAGPSPDIRDNLQPLPFDQTRVEVWPILGMVAAAALAVWGLFLLGRKRWRRAPTESPEARARRRLSELAAAPEVSRVLRQYLQERFGLRATRLTSEEMVEKLRGLGVLTAECEPGLRALLADCDRSRYGGVHSIEGDRDAAVALARGIIDSLGGQAASTPQLVRTWKRWDHAAI